MPHRVLSRSAVNESDITLQLDIYCCISKIYQIHKNTAYNLKIACVPGIPKTRVVFLRVVPLYTVLDQEKGRETTGNQSYSGGSTVDQKFAQKAASRSPPEAIKTQVKTTGEVLILLISFTPFRRKSENYFRSNF